MVAAVESMSYAGEVPWHGLGVKVHNDLTTEQMQEKAGLDWTVDKFPAFARIPVWDDAAGKFNEKEVQTGRSALVRSSDNRVLSVISNDWEPVQNSEAFRFFHDFVMAGDMEMHTAGSLFSGEIIWVLARVKKEFKVFGKDEVDSYLLFSNPHQYGKSIDIRFTPIRVVCYNTLSMALSGRGDLSYKMNHRRVFDPSIAKKAIGLADKKMDEYQELAEFLGSRRYNMETIVQYFNSVFPTSSTDADGNEKTSRNAVRALNMLDKQPGAEYGAGTWWSALNAVTYMTNHVIGRNPTTRLESTWYGPNRRLAMGAFEKALEFAKAS
jgi:phage/plasmid-like protein (TIGR03299 family)